ncbi:hypothetical protein POM88_045277 [Heracleum sosnowskyi]|uniref:Uncharacterized protein n=1 Tax=Heracleum sosnowskyi TaxID=360622 RepID=A0AAD8H657_9APIA|nr:hypothetical protein POM88_045277 [Heracleum sosnowskyi]
MVPPNTMALQVIYPISTTPLTQEVLRIDQGVVEPQPLSPVIEPHTESNPLIAPLEQPATTRLNEQVEVDINESDPTALSPPLKKRRTLLEASVSQSVSSQKDMDSQKANEQLLETSSQQDESIEIRHQAMAFCTESSTLPLLTMGANTSETIVETHKQDTLRGEHIGMLAETVPTIVTVEEPSQASEGKSDSLPPIIESFSPLPEGTSLAPLRDSSLAVLTGESEGQPGESITEAIQFSVSDYFLDYTGDWDLRTPIAPPVTSQKGAMVIFSAGTSTPHMDKQLVIRSERQTQSDTQARESSSSTSVTNQLGHIRDEIEGVKVSLIPKINAVQESQVLVASDISELTISNAEIRESVKQIASISTQVNSIQETVDYNQWYNDQRFSNLEGGMVHLNEGMKHLYNMIKSSHQPNAEQRKFFEGDDDADDKDGEGGNKDEDPKADKVKSVEDTSTKGENKEKEIQGGEEVRDQGGEAGGSGSGKDKGKQKLTFSDADYYQGEQGDFDDIESGETPEDIFGEVEVEEEADFADWEDEPEVDPAFEAELLRQKADLKRREDENAKVSDIITKHLVIQKAEHQENQRLHDLKVKDRKLYVRLKLGEEWDRAREMFSHPTGSDNDGRFFSMLERYRKVNPDNTIYMKALHAEISRITTGFDRVREELKIYIYTHNEGTFIVSLNLLEGRTLSELWVFMTKVKRSSPLCELLHDQLRDFAMKASPQVVDVPYEVKFYKGRALQTCAVDPISLKDYPAKHLVYMENMLRTTGFATQEKTEVADLIQDYCIANIKRYHQMKNRLKKVTAQPVRPSGITSESDRILDKDLLDALEEGEMFESEI